MADTTEKTKKKPAAPLSVSEQHNADLAHYLTLPDIIAPEEMPRQIPGLPSPSRFKVVTVINPVKGHDDLTVGQQYAVRKRIADAHEHRGRFEAVNRRPEATEPESASSIIARLTIKHD